MKKTILIAALLTFVIKSSIFGQTVTINVDLGSLKDANGNIIPDNSLIMIVASTLDNNFSGPSPTSFVSSADDQILYFGANIGGDPGTGTASIPLNSIPLVGNLTQGDHVGVYWFPTLSGINPPSQPGFNTPYGFFSDPNGNYLNIGNHPWVIPSPGAAVTFSFINQTNGGIIPDNSTLFNANFTTIPEPSTYALIILGLGGLVWVMRRRARVNC